MIRVVQPGLLTTVQDLGRHGLRRLGIPWAGAMTPAWMTMANRLVGNTDQTPILEVYEGGLTLDSGSDPIRIAIAGDAEVTCQSSSSTSHSLACWRSHSVAPGSTIRILSTGNARVAVVALAGLQVPAHHGSASTYTRAGLGGLSGTALQRDDELSVGSMGDGPERFCQPASLPGDAVRLRAVPGPQDTAFDVEQLDAFFSQPYRLSAEVDRMGARLEGTALSHIDAAHRDIVSDAIVPGSVQVPGNGLPIVLLADAHTAGGYPKIATVISVDLASLALSRPGATVRFKRLSAQAAVIATREAQQAVDDWLNAMDIVRNDAPDSSTLLSSNLIDGVTDGSQNP